MVGICPGPDVCVSEDLCCLGLVLEEGGRWGTLCAAWSALRARCGVLRWRGWRCQHRTRKNLSEGAARELGLDGALGRKFQKRMRGCAC